MKIVRVLVLVLVGLMLSVAGYGEIIYTKDGNQIQGKITEITEDTIWVEITTEGDIKEYTGIDKSNVQKILNDDGSKYNYVQTDKK